MPDKRNDRKWIAQRNESIREAALDGHSTAWIAATFGVSNTTIYRACRNLALPSVGPSNDEPPAEWEALVEGGIDLALVPSDDWLFALLDAEPRSVEPCVYFVQQEGTRFVKIGVSSPAYMQERLRQLQVGNPSQLVVRRMVKGDFNVEAVLHAAFAHLHVRGEWFDCDTELAQLARIARSAS